MGWKNGLDLGLGWGGVGWFLGVALVFFSLASLSQLVPAGVACQGRASASL
jgi:hypothetical protein